MSRVELYIGGEIHSGWEAVSVTRSIETISGTFELRLSERNPVSPSLRRIGPGKACELRLDGTVVVSGYVDDLAVTLEADTHTIRVSGRDKTGDLVDCSVVVNADDPESAGEWEGAKLEQICRQICKPFGITVSALQPTGEPFRRFKTQEGESAYEAIVRACKNRALLPTAGPDGNLVLMRPGPSSGGRIAEGDNALALRGTFNDRDRHNRYIVKGQAGGDDKTWGASVTTGKSEATDPAVTRYRPLIVISEDHGEAGTLANRVKWEAATRAGQARRVEATVQGWRDGGRLWSAGDAVTLDSPTLGLETPTTMTIAGVTFTLDEKGTLTNLTLVHPKAFELRTLPKGEAEAGW